MLLSKKSIAIGIVATLVTMEVVSVVEAFPPTTTTIQHSQQQFNTPFNGISFHGGTSSNLQEQHENSFPLSFLTKKIIKSKQQQFQQRTFFGRTASRRSIITRPSTSLLSLSGGMQTDVPLIGYWYMMLLALQFGTQPILTKKFAPKTICRSTIVLAQEVTKLVLCFGALVVGKSWKSSLANAAGGQGWTIMNSLTVAGIPSILYIIQNYCCLIAYQNLQPVTFNVLNQTKTLSAALCCFLLLGKVQSKLQIISLILLLFSALIIEKIIPLPFGLATTKEEEEKAVAETSTTTSEEDTKKTSTHFISGVVPILLASFISGLAGAFVQKSLQYGGGRNSYLFTMELAVVSIITLIGSLLIGQITGKNPDMKKIQDNGISYGWTYKTWIPVITTSVGGMLVGLVTKHAGAVKKGFALIFGLLLSGILQQIIVSDEDGGSNKITSEQIVGGIIASISLYMHSKFPYVAP